MKNLIDSPIFWGIMSISMFGLGFALKLNELTYSAGGVLLSTVAFSFYHAIKNSISDAKKEKERKNK